MIKIGTSGFSFKDWIGNVYPDKIKTSELLHYYEEEFEFDCVEINSTYYTLISDRSFESMAEKTSRNFEFAVKAYKGITHDPFDKRINKGNYPHEKISEDLKKFIYSITPLKKKNKLACVLLQFPVFFYPDETTKDYILFCKENFADINVVVEFRNNKWATQESFTFLKENKISYCAVDEPKLPGLMPFVNEVTSDIAYLRFHGRNKNWFNADVSERYNYLYSDSELHDFIPEINKMSEKARKTYIFFNNCHAGKAVQNARRLKELLGLSGSGSNLF